MNPAHNAMLTMMVLTNADSPLRDAIRRANAVVMARHNASGSPRVSDVPNRARVSMATQATSVASTLADRAAAARPVARATPRDRLATSTR